MNTGKVEVENLRETLLKTSCLGLPGFLAVGLSGRFCQAPHLTSWQPPLGRRQEAAPSVEDRRPVSPPLPANDMAGEGRAGCREEGKARVPRPRKAERGGLP